MRAVGAQWGHLAAKNCEISTKRLGPIWFSDPPSGIAGYYLGEAAQQELPNNLYRLDPKTRQASVATAGLVQRPNGLAFSPGESRLYVIESGDPRAIYVFDVVDEGARLANGRVLIECEPDETPDGLRVDVDGNLWCGWGMGPPFDGVKVFNPAGKAIGFIALPERAANVCFGGPKRNRLFMAASRSVYSLYVNTQGAAGG
jgi:gluconolactonase